MGGGNNNKRITETATLDSSQFTVYQYLSLRTPLLAQALNSDGFDPATVMVVL